MKSEQPKALYLAANCDPEDAFEVACSKELRRLHEENIQLLAGYEAARLEIASLKAKRHPMSSWSVQQARLAVTPDPESSPEPWAFRMGVEAAELFHDIRG